VCEEKESMELSRLGVFWEEKGRVVDGADGEAEDREKAKEEKEWEKEVVGALESLKTVQVADGWVFFLLKSGEG
jgi:nuclear pore complex protein Nup107